LGSSIRWKLSFRSDNTYDEALVIAKDAIQLWTDTAHEFR